MGISATSWASKPNQFSVNKNDHFSKDSLTSAEQDEATEHAAANDNVLITTLIRTAAESPETTQHRLTHIQTARNPLYQAAKPLLLTLAKLPDMQLEGHVQIEAFRQLLQREVISFQTLCNRANLQREHITTASYCLCTALDEAANSTLWGGGQQSDLGPWAKEMLAHTFHEDTSGGSTFFMLVGRLSTQPELHKDLLELMYFILSLGFQGKHHNTDNGAQHLDMIRQRLYTLFMAGREPLPRALSSQWQGAGAGRFRMLRSIPVWVSVSLFSLISLGMLGASAFQLNTQRQQLVQDIQAIGNMTPPVEIIAPLKLAQLLHHEIAQGWVAVDENATRSHVTFQGDDMFVAGKALVSQKMLPLLRKVATGIAKVIKR